MARAVVDWKTPPGLARLAATQLLIWMLLARVKSPEATCTRNAALGPRPEMTAVLGPAQEKAGEEVRT